MSSRTSLRCGISAMGMARRANMQLQSWGMPGSTEKLCIAKFYATAVAEAKHHDTLNAPDTAHPPPLEVPGKRSDENTFKRLAGIAKAYMQFYKTGMKNTFTNRTLAKDINTKIHGWSRKDAIKEGLLTRSELMLLKRNDHDMKRLPAFAVVLAIFWEFTPLAVIAYPDVVPWTCRMASQINKDWKKLEDKRESSFRSNNPDYLYSTGSIESLSVQQLRHLARSLGLNSSPILEAVGFPPQSTLVRTIKTAMEEIELDDELLRKGDGPSELKVPDLKLALVQRGQRVVGRSEHELRETLRDWLNVRETESAHSLLLQKGRFLA